MKKHSHPKVANKKKKSSSSSSKKIQHTKKLSTKKKVLIGFIVLLLASIVTYFSIAWYQGYAFKKVEKKMDILTQEIVAKLGEPVSQSQEQSCGYASDTFRRGQLSCGSIYTYKYNLINSKSTEYISSVRDAIESSSLFSIIYRSNLKSLKSSSAGDTFYNNKGINCYTGYQYSDNTKSIISLSIACSSKPLRPIFPVKD